MRKIYTLLTSLILFFGINNGLFAQSVNVDAPEGLYERNFIQLTNQVITLPGSSRSVEAPASRANTSFTMDYDSLSGNDAAFFWILNKNFTGSGNLNYAVVAFDSLVDPGGTAYDYDAHNVVVDSIDIFISHVNASGQQDTLAISLVELDTNGLWTNNVFWSDTLFASSSLTSAVNSFAVLSVNPNFAVCTGRFGVRVDFAGPVSDTIGVIAGLREGDCDTATCVSGGPGAEDFSAVFASSQYGYQNGPNNPIDVPQAGLIYRDCNGDMSFTPGSCEVWFIQDFWIFPSVTISDAPAPIIFATVMTTPDDGSGNGTAWVDVMGGLGSYEVLWSNGATTDTITGLSAGPVSVTVTYGNNCASALANGTVASTVGIEDEINAGISRFLAFPNPVVDRFSIQIELNQVDDLNIQLYDLYGKVVFSEEKRKVQSYGRDLSLGDMPAGVYLLEVQTTQGRASKRIVVR